MGLGREQAAELMGSISALLRTARAAAHRHGAEMGAAGTPLAMLKAVREAPARPSDLATTLQVTPSVVSRTIARLEESGLVERTADPDDARSTWIAPTAAGRAELARMQQAFVDEARGILDDWTDEEAEQAARLITRLDLAISHRYTGTAQRLIAEALTVAEPDTRRDALASV